MTARRASAYHPPLTITLEARTGFQTMHERAPHVDLLVGPDGYRHLAYVQTAAGFDIKRDMPGLVGPEVELLYRRGAAWLAGEPLHEPLQTRPQS